MILVSKFTEGAWITLLLLGALLVMFGRVGAPVALDQEVRSAETLDLAAWTRPVVVVPIKRLDRVARKAVRFALTLARDEVAAVQLLAVNRARRICRPPGRRWSRSRAASRAAAAEAGGAAFALPRSPGAAGAHVSGWRVPTRAGPSW